MSNFDVTDLVIQQEAARQASQDLSKALSLTTRATDSLRISTISLQATLVQNIDFVHKLTQAVQKQEKLQLKANALGLDFNKFMSKNSEKLEKFAMLFEGREFMLGAFDAGLRRVSDGVVDLANDMTKSGQNTAALIQAMVGFGLVTDQSTEAQESLARITRETSKKYLVSNERLLEGLASFQSQLEEFRLYGTEAVGNFAEFSTVLMGLAGGSEPAKKQIGIFLQMLDGMNIQQQQLLGLTRVTEDMYSGGVTQRTLEDIVKASDKMTEILGSNRIQQGAIAEVYGKPQINALLMLGGLIKANNKDIKTLKEVAGNEAETLRSRQAQIDKFYDTFAPELHGTITTFLPLIYTVVGAMGALQGAKGIKDAVTNLAALGAGRASGMLAGAAVRGLGAAGAVAARGLAFLGGPVAIIASVGYGIYQLVDLMMDSNEGDKEIQKELKEQTKILKEQSPVDINGRLSMATRVAGAMLAPISGGPEKLYDVLSLIEKNTRVRQGSIDPVDGSSRKGP